MKCVNMYTFISHSFFLSEAFHHTTPANININTTTAAPTANHTHFGGGEDVASHRPLTSFLRCDSVHLGTHFFRTISCVEVSH